MFTTMRLLGRHVQNANHSVDRIVELDWCLRHTKRLRAGITALRLGEATKTSELATMARYGGM